MTCNTELVWLWCIFKSKTISGSGQTTRPVQTPWMTLIDMMCSTPVFFPRSFFIASIFSPLFFFFFETPWTTLMENFRRGSTQQNAARNCAQNSIGSQIAVSNRCWNPMHYLHRYKVLLIWRYDTLKSCLNLNLYWRIEIMVQSEFVLKNWMCSSRGVATISRPLQIIRLFCRISSLL